MSQRKTVATISRRTHVRSRTIISALQRKKIRGILMYGTWLTTTQSVNRLKRELEVERRKTRRKRETQRRRNRGRRLKRRK